MEYTNRRGSSAFGTVPGPSGPGTTPSPFRNLLPDDHRSAGMRYADRRGRTGGIDANLLTLGLAGSRYGNGNMSTGSYTGQPVEVLYPGTSKLRGGLLTSLIQTDGLDPNFVQRFQNIAIITQLAESIIAVAQATGKCIVPVDHDSDLSDLENSCSWETDGGKGEKICKMCLARQQASGNDRKGNNGREKEREKEREKMVVKARAKKKVDEKEKIEAEKIREKGDGCFEREDSNKRESEIVSNLQTGFLGLTHIDSPLLSSPISPISSSLSQTPRNGVSQTLTNGQNHDRLPVKPTVNGFKV